MVEKKPAEARLPSPAESSTTAASAATQPVIDLLASILSEVRNRVQVTPAAPDPLVGEAQRAASLFKEIEAAIQLTARPTVTLIANPSTRSGEGLVNLVWTSTSAQTVSIVGVTTDGQTVPVGVVAPASGGTVGVNVSTTTRFTVTASGRCQATASVEVPVGGVIF